MICMLRGVQILTIACCLSGPALYAYELDLRPSPTCVFSGSFAQSKTLTGLSAPLESSGVFFYDCSRGVVWKTTAPLMETLVLTRNGQSFKVEDARVTALFTRHIKLLGELMNGLIGGNQDYITEHFDVSDNAPETITPGKLNHLLLVPKNRRLKRALQRIELILPNSEILVDNEVVNISMLDRNRQWTRITSTKLVDFDDAENTIAACDGLSSITAQECALLHVSGEL